MREESREAGEAYWQAIEPIWDVISIYDGPDVFLAQFRSVIPQLGHLFAAHWCQSEVCNGGFHQFFWNSTGVLAPEAVNGFIALGLPDCAAIIKDAMAFFGPNYPREQSKRIEVLNQLSQGGFAEEYLFKELDDRFFVALGERSERFCGLADDYARATVP
jgi:hypothetical protein